MRRRTRHTKKTISEAMNRDLLGIIFAYGGLSNYRKFVGISGNCRQIAKSHTFFISLDKSDINKIYFIKSRHPDYLLDVEDYLLDVELVVRCLGNPRFNPTMNNNSILGWASSENHINIVKMLLSDPLVDPSDRNNDAIYVASANGNLEIIKMLLADPLTDPSDQTSPAIIGACEYGRLDAVKLLLDHPHIQFDIGMNEAISQAIKGNHIEIIEFLLNDSRIELNKFNEIIQFSLLENSSAEIIQLLLEDSRTSFDDSEIDIGGMISQAVLTSTPAIVKLLLDKLWQNPGAKLDGDTIKAILENGDLDLIKMFIRNGQLDINRQENIQLIHRAAIMTRNKGSLDVARYLMTIRRQQIVQGRKRKRAEDDDQ